MDESTSVAELPLEGAGARLLRAREAKNLSRAQLAGLTKIPERHLVAIEQGNFALLPANAYAIGFSRSYARAVGLHEREIADEVRAELASADPVVPRRVAPAFEPGDPARVPSARVAWIAGLLALVVTVAGLSYWRGSFGAGGDLPSILPNDAPLIAAASPPAAPVAASGSVVFTALEPAIWVKFYDGAGTQLIQKELGRGESYTVPGNVSDVRLWTARPEALAISVDGRPVAKLADEQRMMKDVPVTAAALLARQEAAPVARSSPPAELVPVPRPRASSSPSRAADSVPRVAEPTPLASSVPAPLAAAPSPSPAASADR